MGDDQQAAVTPGVPASSDPAVDSLLTHPSDPSAVADPAIPPVDPTAASAVAPEPRALPAPDVPAVVADDGDLLSIKQQALEQIMPLIDKLDQTPEDKFRTIMMIIQSSDNKALIHAAYDAAEAIPDEKVRAQALLDVVNEINYFTQAHPATA